jgi:predicted nucleotidyltransferase component of viral defense system
MVAFHAQAITAECQQALRLLRGQPQLASFYLAGGTALALQIGHRISTDLDWFTPSHLLESAERDALRSTLSATGAFEVTREQDGQLYTRIAGADVSFIYQHHPLLEPTVDYDEIRLASPTDIGVMKLAAINSRGTRRDFVDLYCLKDSVSLQRLIELAEIKYVDRPTFLDIAVRALAYFADAEQQPMPRMLWKNVQWVDVMKYCEAGAKWLTQRLRDKHR